MTKEEHLQRQLNLQYTAMTNFMEGIAATGTSQQREMISAYLKRFQEVYDELDRKYESGE